MTWDDTELPWVAPSPNMPTLDTAAVYPGGCLIEGTNLSEGRGTTRPFEWVGAPWLDEQRFARHPDGRGTSGGALPSRPLHADLSQVGRPTVRRRPDPRDRSHALPAVPDRAGDHRRGATSRASPVPLAPAPLRVRASAAAHRHPVWDRHDPPRHRAAPSLAEDRAKLADRPGGVPPATNRGLPVSLTPHRRHDRSLEKTFVCLSTPAWEPRAAIFARSRRLRKARREDNASRRAGHRSPSDNASVISVKYADIRVGRTRVPVPSNRGNSATYPCDMTPSLNSL